MMPRIPKLTDVLDRDRASHAPSFLAPLSDCLRLSNLSSSSLCAPSALSQATALCPRSLREPPATYLARTICIITRARSATRRSAGRIIEANDPTTRRDPISTNLLHPSRSTAASDIGSIRKMEVAETGSIGRRGLVLWRYVRTKGQELSICLAQSSSPSISRQSLRKRP